MASGSGVAVQRALDELAASFLLPLLSGGTVQLGAPIGPGALAHFAVARPSDSDVEWRVLDALHAAATAVAPLRADPRLDGDLLALCIAAHDLLLLTDPSLGTWPAKRAQPKLRGWVEAVLASIAPPRTRTAALTRHAIVARLLELERRDVVVKNWAYTYRFFGRPVPPRVVALPRLRFVRTTESTTTLDAAVKASGPATAPLLDAIVACSPLTRLLRAPEHGPALTLDVGVAAVLSDPVLRGAVARAAEQVDPEAIGGVWQTVLRSLAGSAQAAPAVTYAVAALLVETHVLAALARDDNARTHVGSGPYAALFPAAYTSGLLSTVLSPSEMELALLQAHARACAAAADAAATATAQALVARALVFFGAPSATPEVVS